MINRRGYENNQLAAAYRHNRRLMVAYGGGLMSTAHQN